LAAIASFRDGDFATVPIGLTREPLSAQASA
jgi:hypothetical protein